jgi:site-specific DNA-methyltransferase (adenine-specific)
MNTTTETLTLESPAQAASVTSGGVGSSALLGSVHFSSASDEWPTPRAYFETVEREFGPFDLDPCATPASAKAPKYFTKADDGLAQEWRGRVWMNPPYGRTIGAWMRKAYEAAQAGAVVVCLVPARTDTAWWHDYAAKGTVRFLRGRLKFGDAKNSAPFPSALVVFGMPNATRKP